MCWYSLLAFVVWLRSLQTFKILYSVSTLRVQTHYPHYLSVLFISYCTKWKAKNETRVVMALSLANILGHTLKARCIVNNSGYKSIFWILRVIFLNCLKFVSTISGQHFSTWALTFWPGQFLVPGASCALQDVWLHPWSVRTRCQ